MKILIADSSTLTGEHLTFLCNNIEGVEVIGNTTKVLETYKTLKRHKADLIIIDENIDEGGSIPLLKSLKKLAYKPIVILLSSFPYAQFKKFSHKLGVDYFFEKSMGFAPIDEVIKHKKQVSLQNRKMMAVA